jgi:hypothetical protein
MTLRQFGKRWFHMGHSLQCFAFICFLGSNTALAHYAPQSVPSGGYQLVWQSSDPEPLDGPDFSDHDLDGLPAWLEIWLGIDPLLYDTDYDGINDGDELYTTGTNPLDWDTDGNGQLDLADFYAANPPDDNPGTTEEEGTTSTEESPPADTDGDGLSDDFETSQSLTDPGLSDTDSNGRSDYDDHYYPVTDPDSDSDGVPDSTETTEGTDPSSVDSDGDGLTDGEETNVFGTDPTNAYSLSAQYTDWYMVDTTDTDGGGIPDRIESYLGMNSNDGNDDLSGDLDGDGTSNAEAYNNGNSPDAHITESYDRDSDGMTDVWEVANDLNPDDGSDAGEDPDTDGYSNGEEFQNGTNPHVYDSEPGLQHENSESYGSHEHGLDLQSGSQGQEEPETETEGWEVTPDGVKAAIELVCLCLGAYAPYTPVGFACLLIGAVIWGSEYGGDIGITPVP